MSRDAAAYIFSELPYYDIDIIVLKILVNISTFPSSILLNLWL